MAISDELNRIIQAKADIRSALGEKGLVIGESSTLDEYPALIQTMTTGGDNSLLIDVIERDITTIDIPAGTYTIGHFAFSSCSKLREISIPNTVLGIGANAFNYCGLLNHLIIPSSVLAIGPKVFYQNTNLNDMVILKDTPPSFDSDNTFSNNLKIYVKNAAVDSYKNAGGNWNDVSTRITPLASMSYNSSTYTVTALGRPNLELYVDASLCNSSVYTIPQTSQDTSHVIMVKSVDENLGVLDTSTAEVLVPGAQPSATPQINFDEYVYDEEIEETDPETGEPTGGTYTETVYSGDYMITGSISGSTQYVTLRIDDGNGAADASNPTDYDYYAEYGWEETTSNDEDLELTVTATAQEPGKTATSVTKYYKSAENPYPDEPEPEEPDPEPEQLSEPTYDIQPDRDTYNVEITNTDENADEIYYQYDGDDDFMLYDGTLGGNAEGTIIYAYASDSSGEYEDSEVITIVCGAGE